MIMSNFLKSRSSVREFRKKKLDYNLLDEINEDLRLTENELDDREIKFKLYENGEILYSKLKDKGGYGGVMIESPHYIALIRRDEDEDTLIKSGYYMESLISKLNDKGLGTCWVSINDLDKGFKKDVFGDYHGSISHILAFGYRPLKNPFTSEPVSERIGVEEYVFDKEVEKSSNVDDLEAKGLLELFYYLRFAPSTKNLQPWRFLLEDSNIKLLLAYKDWEESFLVDSGIIMYYFEELMKSKGLENNWQLVKEKQDYKTDTFSYKLVSEYNL